jgi:hypothetical protein
MNYSSPLYGSRLLELVVITDSVEKLNVVLVTNSIVRSLRALEAPQQD